MDEETKPEEVVEPVVETPAEPEAPVEATELQAETE